ncbi:hypothetical protein GU700_01140 [Methylobacterium sp. NI91]|nr:MULTISPECIES: hypothetical protein [unclassified Methylobacterium]QIJ73324.1 hypothetical protein CLZ_01140 [Methylobacterium sp. CLZ]QIJ78228.1 hypothetical protein GU700_01140 [Methylobacterium sp. NI91]
MNAEGSPSDPACGLPQGQTPDDQSGSLARSGAIGGDSGSLDLVLACLWASALVAAVALTESVVLRATLGIPLVFLILGHAVLRGLGVRSATPAEHLTFAVGAGIAACVFGGFVLHLAHALDPLGWALWLWGAVAVAALAASLQTIPARPRLPRRRLGFGLGHAAALCAAALIAGGAVLLATQQEQANRQFAFTEFWLVLKPAAGRIVVGVRSGEIEPLTYDVEITLEGRTLATYRGLTLAPGAEWHREIPVQLRQTQQKAEARLLRRSDNVVYRHVSAILPRIAS